MRGDGLESFRLFLAFRTFIRHPSKFTVQPMRIALLSSEVVPFAKTGGLADVAGALPKALARHDVDARIILPLYQQIDRSLLNDSVIEDVPVEWRGRFDRIGERDVAQGHARGCVVERQHIVVLERDFGTVDAVLDENVGRPGQARGDTGEA